MSFQHRGGKPAYCSTSPHQHSNRPSAKHEISVQQVLNYTFTLAHRILKPAVRLLSTMSEKPNLLKRSATRDGSVSPPPVRRKIQSTTTRRLQRREPLHFNSDKSTESAVASFFKPTSEKPPEKISWQERAEHDDKPATLLVGKYVPSDAVEPQSTAPFKLPRRKIAAFDFVGYHIEWKREVMLICQDSTLITTSSGKKHASGAGDWKWWHPSVPGALRKLYNEEGYDSISCLSDLPDLSQIPCCYNKQPGRNRIESKLQSIICPQSSLYCLQNKGHIGLSPTQFASKHICCHRKRHIPQAPHRNVDGAT